MKTILHTKPGCVQCKMMERKLDSLDVDYEIVDIYENPELADEFRAKNWLSMPVVLYPDGDHSLGFRPDVVEAKFAA